MSLDLLTENTLYKKNISLFKSRFLELYGMLENRLGKIPENLEILECKADKSKKTAKYNGQFLHSAYNPEKEAEKLLTSELGKCQNPEVLVFYGFGLGYLPLEAAKKHRNKTLVLVEPNIDWLTLAFSTTDFSEIFAPQNLILCIEANIQGVLKLLENFGLKNCCFIKNPLFAEHDKKYFSDLDSLIQRNIQKDSINARTLKAFSKLWFSNMCKNISHLAENQGKLWR